jgi:hypothetical protein
LKSLFSSLLAFEKFAAFTHTWPTYPVSSAPVRVFCGEFVAALAVCLCRIDRRWADAAKGVCALGDGFHVARVDASTVPAKMIYF